VGCALETEKYAPCFALIRHLTYVPERPDGIVYRPHIPTTHGTADYNDNIAALNAIKLEMQNRGHKAMVVIGDQRSYSRMIHMKRMEPSKYSWVIPFPGEFHYAVHLLMALHILFRAALIDRLIDVSGVARKTCGTEGMWSSVEKYNNYCFLYEAVIVAIFTYLRSFVPLHLFYDYDALKALASENAGATCLLEFLDHALAWLSFAKRRGQILLNTWTWFGECHFRCSS